MQVTGIPFHPVQYRAAAGACVIHPVAIAVEPGDPEAIRCGAAAEPARAAPHVEQAVARLRREHVRGQGVFGATDPAPARGVIPGIVFGRIQVSAADSMAGGLAGKRIRLETTLGFPAFDTILQHLHVFIAQ